MPMQIAGVPGLSMLAALNCVPGIETLVVEKAAACWFEHLPGSREICLSRALGFMGGRTGG